MKIACGKYKITILQNPTGYKHITHFCGVIQSNTPVLTTGQQNGVTRVLSGQHRITLQVSEVKKLIALKRVFWQRSTF